MVWMTLEPRRHTKLRVTIARRHVDVVDAVLQEQLECSICDILRDA